MIKITDIPEELFLNWIITTTFSSPILQKRQHILAITSASWIQPRENRGSRKQRSFEEERLEKGAHPWNFFAGPRTDINLNRTRFEHVSWGVSRKWSATTLPANLTSIIRVKVLSKRSHLQHGPVLYDGNRIRGNAPTRLQLAPKLAGKVRDPKTILSYAKKPEYPPPLSST